MKYPLKTWTEMDQHLKGKLEQKGLDLGFIDFVLEGAGLKDSEVLPLYPPKLFSASERKRQKRKIQKTHGEDWKKEWERILASMKSARKATRKVQVIANKKKYDPIRKEYERVMIIEPTGRKPKEICLLRAVYLLQSYVMYYTGRVDWSLIAEIVKPYYDKRVQRKRHACAGVYERDDIEMQKKLTGAELASWWHHRKKDFEIYDQETILLLEINHYANALRDTWGWRPCMSLLAGTIGEEEG